MVRGTLGEQKTDMERRHGVRWILLGSLCVHLLLLAGLLGVFYRPPEVVMMPANPSEPQFVDLLDASELPEDLPLPDLPQAPEERPKDVPPKEELLAFQSISTLPVEPSPSPSPSATASPLPTALPTATPLPFPTPTPTVKPSPTPRRPRTPMPKFNWTPKPRPTLRETVKPAIRLEPYKVPKRAGVLEPTPVIVRRTPEAQGGSRVRGRGGQQHFLGSRSSLVLDQEKEFPFPGYLLHLEEKIAGLWFPQGAGAVTIYLEIGRNGKILKSEVDKGTGVGVQKLQESVARALSLIQHFEALPWEYPGMTLRVRIIVRR